MKRILIAIVAIAGTVAVGGVAWAAIPAGNGVITACTTRLGTVRIIDAEAGARCLSVEQSLKWNQTGPQGAPGAAGATGATGPTGPAGSAGGSSVIVARFGGWWPIIAGTTQAIQGLQLPNEPGTYLIEATARAHTDALNARSYLFCDLFAGTQQLDSYMFNFAEDEDYDRESAQLTGWLDATGLEVVELRCTAQYADPTGLGSNIGIDTGGAVVATRVDSLTEAP